ncbi:MAG: isoaspartyl peptidase/L-asparaginase, partial [Haloarculaceae archaeon]
MRVIVHGGAGSRPARRGTEVHESRESAPETPAAREATLDEAAAAGADAADPAAAVVAAVRVLERDPAFNAGVGSVPQADGVIRTDAGLMTGDRAAGAACGMPGVEAAVEVARLVKTETPHVLLAGVHAVDLADAFGVETGVDLWTDRQRERWDALETHPPVDDVRAQLDWSRDRFGGGDGGDRLGGGERPADHDTVGAVAVDGERVAAATSTGGRWLAAAGRVGDVPQVGSGFYAS